MNLIYGIIHNDSIVYVGQTKLGLKKRILNYKRSMKDLNKKTYVINFLRKKIDECRFVILQELECAFELDSAEIALIKHHNTLYPNGLNLTEGGGAPIFSAETRSKMSLKKIGSVPWNKDKKLGSEWPWNKGVKTGPQSEETKTKKARYGADNHFFGKKHTIESLQKMSKSLMGRKVWNCQYKKIDQLNENLQIIATYNSSTELRTAGFDSSSVTRCIKNPKWKHKGFYFRFSE